MCRRRMETSPALPLQPRATIHNPDHYVAWRGFGLPKTWWRAPGSAGLVLAWGKVGGRMRRNTANNASELRVENTCCYELL